MQNLQFQNLEKFRSSIEENSNYNVKISKNIFEFNGDDKIILVKNTRPISYKELTKLTEKINFLDKKIIGWFVVD